MKKLRLAVLAATLLLLTLVMPGANALPSHEVENYYYDENWNLIGEKDILCGGAHYQWGVTTGAPHMSQLSSSCDTGQGSWHCYTWGVNGYVEVDLTYCGL